MKQVEFLLRLSENAQDAGDEIAERHRNERAAHIKELLELDRMIEAAKQCVYSELMRFGYHVPKAEQLPEQGPRPSEIARQAGTKPPGGNNAAQTGVGPADDKREHQRALPSRQ